MQPRLQALENYDGERGGTRGPRNRGFRAAITTGGLWAGNP
jgi:hypothetical protein